MYFIKASPVFKKLYPKNFLWKGDAQNSIYLSFDDGPHPIATPFVLDTLKKYNAKATFFCIGKNVIAHPELYARILSEGHQVGNHTQNHKNGWKENCKDYIADVHEAAQQISSKLFRPPYGRIKRKQAEALSSLGYSIVMWDILSGDFDPKISPQKCWENVSSNIEDSSIVVFHDSTKAFDRLQFALPLTLALCAQKGWQMKSLS